MMHPIKPTLRLNKMELDQMTMQAIDKIGEMKTKHLPSSFEIQRVKLMAYRLGNNCSYF
jgi:hypothetical protein